MVSYKDLGLVNTREMFAKAIKGGYAVPAFNFNNMEQLQAIIKAAAEDKSPVILQVSKGARNYANPILLLLNTPRPSVGNIPKSCFTSTTVTASSSARTVSNTASRQ